MTGGRGFANLENEADTGPRKRSVHRIILNNRITDLDERLYPRNQPIRNDTRSVQFAPPGELRSSLLANVFLSLHALEDVIHHRHNVLPMEDLLLSRGECGECVAPQGTIGDTRDDW